ncbi:MAG: DUF488 domain-containing protein [Desulfotignum sp.]|nr:DUF488 domain-containing protein [Desulfotignum sp.]
MTPIYTIGHSTHTTDEFLSLLKRHAVTAVADVRSSPYSRFNPQFNRETLEKDLKAHRIAYVYLGDCLGPRSGDPGCYVDGKAAYRLIAETELFRQGINRLKKGMAQHTIALMCSEKDPVSCHRMILVCRHLKDNTLEILHILEDGNLETNEAAEKRLMKLLKIPELDLFAGLEELIDQAYDIQGEKIAYQPPDATGSP